MSTPYIGDVDFGNLYFAPMVVDKTRKSVAMYMTKGNTTYANRVLFQLVPDEESPAASRYKVEAAAEDQDPSRLKQTVMLNAETHQKTIEKLQELDRLVLAEATAKSKEWWKKELPAEAVAYKYKPLIAWDDKVESYQVSYKVIVPHPKPEFGKKYSKATSIYKVTDDDKVVASEHSILTQGSLMTPSVSTVGVWFMGDNQFGVSLRADVLLCKTLVTPSPLDSLRLKRKYVEVSTEEAEAEAAPEGGSSGAAGAPAPLRVELDDDVAAM